jgi:putative colanic acid biosysnthesis UDP-glucose lipid carrier transferase
MRTRVHLIYLLYLSFDLIAILLALILSAIFSISPYVIPYSNQYTLANLEIQNIYLLLAILWYFSARSTGLYENPRSKMYSIDAYNILKNIFFQIVCLMLVFFIIKERALTRTFFIVYFSLVTIFIFIGKITVRLILRIFREKFNDSSRVVIIGANELGRNVYDKLCNHSVGYKVIGFIDDDPPEAMKDRNILGNSSDIETILSRESIEIAFIALSKISMETLENIIEICRKHVVEVKIIPDVASYYLRNFKYSFLADIPVVSVSIDKLAEPYWRIVKRIFDICITLFLTIIIFSWFIPIIIILHKIFNRGPVFYKSERWGKGGNPFWIYKFRTMKLNDGKKANDQRTVPTEINDPRVTKFGKILRRTSLDELPQFYNVLKGEMSIIGPRPFDSNEAIMMKQILGNYMIRYYVKPGITGWAQINGYRGGTRDLEKMQKRIDTDNWYTHNWTIGLDIQILFYTIIKLFTGDTNAY